MIFLRAIAAALFWAAFLVMCLLNGLVLVTALVVQLLGRCAGYARATPADRNKS